MKRLITICLIIATTFTVQAQDMNFDETASYIKEKILAGGCNSRYGQTENDYSTVCIYIVEIEKNGQIVFGYDHNDKEYSNAKFNINNIIKIELDDTYGKKYIRFYTSDKSYYIIETVSQVESERLVKAFTHLKTVCTKTKDPFDK